MDYFDFSDTDATTSPALFLAYLNEMLSKKFPCVPYISAQEVFRIIDSKKYFLPNLTREDKEYIEMVKDCFGESKFELLYGDFGDCFDVFTEYLDEKKLDKGLKNLLQVVKNNPITEDEESVIEGRIDVFMDLFTLSNLINMEVYKYLLFTIAHECYHTWFAPGVTGKDSEFAADKFATMIYLQIFQDDKFLGLEAFMQTNPVNQIFDNSTDSTLLVGSDDLDSVENREKGSDVDSLKNDSDDFFDSDEDDDENYEGWGNDDDPKVAMFLGRTVDDVFDAVFRTTLFFEKQTVLHPSVKERTDQIRTAIRSNASEVLQKLKLQMRTMLSDTKNYQIK